MYTWLFLLSFLLALIAAQDSFIFNSNKTILAKCIENYLSNGDHLHKKDNFLSVIADLTARRFSGKNVEKKIFNNRYRYFTRDLQTKRLHNQFSKDKLSVQFRGALKKALEYCATDNIYNPIFEDIKSEISSILNGNPEKEWFYFSLNHTELSECIRNRLSKINNQYKEVELLKIFPDFAARRFLGKCLDKKNWNANFRYLLRDLRSKKVFHQFILADKVLLQFRKALKQALADCASESTPLVTAVPVLPDEPPEIAKVLDLILVQWPDDLHYMVESRDSRTLLRRFAEDAQTALESALKLSPDNELFRLSLRVLWMCRAHAFFHGNDIEMPYILHRYTLNDPRPHTISPNFGIFVGRIAENFTNRNPLMPQSYADKILYIHSADRPNYDGETDFFFTYEKDGMTSAEYYLENQINQFYRVLFFFLELNSRGIFTDADDNYDGPLPNDKIPERIQAIVYNDTSYRNYLLDERFIYELLIDTYSQNEIFQHLVKTARVYEEDLIMLRLNTLSRKGMHIVRTNLNATNTTIKTMSPVTRYQPSGKKDNVWINENGKCFPKRAKIRAFPECICSSNKKNLNTNNSNQSTDSCLLEQENYDVYMTNSNGFIPCSMYHQQPVQIGTTNYNYGYVTYSDDYKQPFQLSAEGPQDLEKYYLKE